MCFFFYRVNVFMYVCMMVGDKVKNTKCLCTCTRLMDNADILYLNLYYSILIALSTPSQSKLSVMILTICTSKCGMMELNLAQMASKTVFIGEESFIFG
jgi:hypothetical protein